MALMLSSDAVPQSQKSERATHPEGKLLIVDDEPAVRRALHSTLFALGFDIGEAASGEEAIALCRISKYDAVLLDINMSGKSGIETCAELRRLLPKLAILMISVNEDEERKVQALEAGADDYVTKPFHMRELTARIRAALRRARTTSTDSDVIILIGDLTLHPTRRLVQIAGSPSISRPKNSTCSITSWRIPDCPSPMLVSCMRSGARSMSARSNTSERSCASCGKSSATTLPIPAISVQTATLVTASPIPPSGPKKKKPSPEPAIAVRLLAHPEQPFPWLPVPND